MTMNLCGHTDKGHLARTGRRLAAQARTRMSISRDAKRSINIILRHLQIVEETMRKLEKIVGRKYNLFDYVGAPDAEKIIIIMGSGAETVHETVEYLVSKGQKVGVLKVRLFRPFSNRHFMAAIPKTVKKIAVLDRTKEPGSLGEPLYLDVRTGIGEAMSDKYAPFKDYPLVVGGRYGLGSKEFTPAMAKAVFDNLDAKEPKNHFAVGITDDVTNSSLDCR